MAHDADIPDLKKKAQEREGPGFAWSKDAVLPPAAPAKASPLAPLAEKLKSLPLGKGAAFAAMMVMGFGLGLAAFGAAFLEVGPAKPGTSGLAAIRSSLRVRSDARNRLRYVVNKGGFFFAPFRGAAGAADGAAPGAEEAAAGLALPEVPDVDVNVNFDAPAAGGRGTGAALAGAASASLGGGAAAGKGAAASGDAAAARFSASAGKISAKGAKKGRVSRTALATSGTKGGKGSQTDFLKTVPTRGATARSAAAPAETRPSSLDFVLGGAGPAGGGAAPAAAVAAAGGAEGGGAGAGTASGGGGSVDPGEVQDPNVVLKQIQALFEKSSEESEKSIEEKKKAKILAAGGHLPQAHYHYNRSEKAKKKSEEYAAQARALTAEIAAKNQPAEGRSPASDAGDPDRAEP